MAEPLKNGFGPDVPGRIARLIAAVHPSFPRAAFTTQALAGYEDLELMPRGRQIAAALRTHLPPEPDVAIGILVASLGSLDEERAEDNPMASFILMPHCIFVADYGLEHFDVSMTANYEFTKRFTAEFSIRPFITRYPGRTLALLSKWTRDPSEDVRRLVSEGTRPRLPWAPRLPEFQADPTPVLDLLERLKDDPSLYVRRSVANNLNDIGKDHPALLVKTAAAWMEGASSDRAWLVRHALRSAVKRGDAGALRVLGYGDAKGLVIEKRAVSPKRVKIGQKVTVAFDVANTGRKARRVMVDFRIHFVKANGGTSPKVFKLKEIEVAPGTSVHCEKRVSVANMTTRKHYAGRHEVDAILNGHVEPVGAFQLSAQKSAAE